MPQLGQAEENRIVLSHSCCDAVNSLKHPSALRSWLSGSDLMNPLLEGTHSVSMDKAESEKGKLTLMKMENVISPALHDLRLPP